MPDLDIIIQIADFYKVDIRELLDGERKSEKMDKDLKETVMKVAEYSNNEKAKFTKIMNMFQYFGILLLFIFMILTQTGVKQTEFVEHISSFSLGLAFGTLVVQAIFTSRYGYKLVEFKKRILKRKI